MATEVDARQNLLALLRHRVETADHLVEYERLLKSLLEARAAVGGDLSDEEEDRFTDALDYHWYSMTPEQMENVR